MPCTLESTSVAVYISCYVYIFSALFHFFVSCISYLFAALNCIPRQKMPQLRAHAGMYVPLHCLCLSSESMKERRIGRGEEVRGGREDDRRCHACGHVCAVTSRSRSEAARCDDVFEASFSYLYDEEGGCLSFFICEL